METKNINALLETVKTLRSKNGCDWDKAQTHKTIRQNMLEEYTEMKQLVPHGMIHLFESGGHPSILTNAERSCQVITDFFKR